MGHIWWVWTPLDKAQLNSKNLLNFKQAELKSSYPKDEDVLHKLVYNGTLGSQGMPLGVQVSMLKTSLFIDVQAE